MGLGHMRPAITAQGPGCGSPFSRASARQRLTLAALTLNRSVA